MNLNSLKLKPFSLPETILKREEKSQTGRNYLESIHLIGCRTNKELYNYSNITQLKISQ